MQGDFLQRIMQGIRAEIAAQKDQQFLWSPIAISLGIGVYFCLPTEPDLWVGVGALLVSFAVFWGLRRLAWPGVFGMAVILIALGFFAAQVRTVSVTAPVLARSLKPVMVSGVVQEIEPLEAGQGSRVTLTNIEIEDLPPEESPRAVRLKLRRDEGVLVGQRVQGLAEINPPSGPVMPGGFDFRRHLFFMGIGGVGFFYQTPEILAPPQGLWRGWIEALRQKIGARIEGALEARPAAVTLALMIGHQKALSEDDMAAIRASGLAHMLSISGLHITLLAGVVFFVVRLGMAGVESFALRHPIKKYAAAIAIGAAVFYMLVAGSTPPTVRSVLMTGLIFLAVIVDRSPFSLRLVAFAAVVILLFRPESLLSVSFQMSFAAVAGLIAFYEGTRRFWSAWAAHASVWKRMAMYACGVFVTTIIATAATALFSVYHFQNFAFVGVVANVLAVPLLSFFIMPFIVLAFFVMPLGLEVYPLRAVGWGAEGILAIAHACAALPFASLPVAGFSFWSFVAFVMAGLWVIMWKGPGKVAALMFIAVGLVGLVMDTRPAILVSEAHKVIGFIGDGELWVSTQRTDSFSRENWERSLGLRPGDAAVLPREGAVEGWGRCAPEGCRFERAGRKIALIYDPYIAAVECTWADVIIALEPLYAQHCASHIVVDKFTTWREGAVGIYLHPLRAVSAAEVIGHRPWAGPKRMRKSQSAD